MKVMQKLKDKQGAVYIRACVILIILSMVFIAVFSFAMAISLAQAQRKGAFQTLDKYTQKNSIEIYDSIKMHSDETQSLDASAFISSLCLAQGLVQEDDDYVSYDNDGDYRFVLSDFQMSFIVENTTKIYVRYNLNIPFRFVGTVTWLSVPMVITSTLNPIYETQDDGLAMYTVNHWKEDLDGNYVLDRSWTLRGTPTNYKFKPPTIAYPGFTAQSFLGQPLKADRTTVFDIYYNRNSYTVSIIAGEGVASVTGAGTYKYGQTVTIKATLKSGYTNPLWTGNVAQLPSTTELTYTFKIYESMSLTVTATP